MKCSDTFDYYIHQLQGASRLKYPTMSDTSILLHTVYTAIHKDNRLNI